MHAHQLSIMSLLIAVALFLSPSTGFAANTVSYQLGHFIFSYPSEWTLAQVGAGVSMRSPDEKHVVYIESFPAVTFEETVGCVVYQYDLMRGVWRWTDFGGTYPVCVGFVAPRTSLNAALYDLGNGMYAFEPYSSNPRTFVLQATGQVLRIRASVVKQSGALDPEALNVIRTLRNVIE